MSISDCHISSEGTFWKVSQLPTQLSSSDCQKYNKVQWSINKAVTVNRCCENKIWHILVVIITVTSFWK